MYVNLYKIIGLILTSIEEYFNSWLNFKTPHFTCHINAKYYLLSNKEQNNLEHRFNTDVNNLVSQ